MAKSKKSAPKPSGYDQKPNDFWRGSRGPINKPFGASQFKSKGFIGFRRGSR